MCYKEFGEKSFINSCLLFTDIIEGNFGFQIPNADCLLKVRVGGTISFISYYNESEFFSPKGYTFYMQSLTKHSLWSSANPKSKPTAEDQNTLCLSLLTPFPIMRLCSRRCTQFLCKVSVIEQYKALVYPRV